MPQHSNKWFWEYITSSSSRFRNSRLLLLLTPCWPRATIPVLLVITWWQTMINSSCTALLSHNVHEGVLSTISMSTITNCCWWTVTTATILQSLFPCSEDSMHEVMTLFLDALNRFRTAIIDHQDPTYRFIRLIYYMPNIVITHIRSQFVINTFIIILRLPNI